MRKISYTKLGDVIEISPRSPKLDSETDVSFLAMADLSEGGEQIGGSVKKYKEVCKGYTTFQNGDVLVAKITPCFENGKGALVTSLVNGIGFGSTEFHVLRPSNKIDPYLLLTITQSQSFRLMGASEMSGSAGQKRVPASFISDYEIYLPPLPEQRKIAAILRTWDEGAEKADVMAATYRAQKRGLMQQLLSGQVRVKGEDV
jgi:type I restriction enzyme S subunit